MPEESRTTDDESREHENALEAAYRRSEHGGTMDGLYLPGGLAIAFGLLGMSPLGLAFVAAGMLEVLVVFGFDMHGYNKFAAAQEAEAKPTAGARPVQDRITSGVANVLSFK